MSNVITSSELQLEFHITNAWMPDNWKGVSQHVWRITWLCFLELKRHAYRRATKSPKRNYRQMKVKQTHTFFQIWFALDWTPPAWDSRTRALQERSNSYRARTSQSSSINAWWTTLSTPICDMTHHQALTRSTLSTRLQTAWWIE